MAGPYPGNAGGGGGVTGSSSPRAKGFEAGTPNTRKTELRLQAVESALAGLPPTPTVESVQSLNKRLVDLTKVVADLGKEVAKLADMLKRTRREVVTVVTTSGTPGSVPGGEATDTVEEVTATADLPAFQAVTITGGRADSANTAHFGKVVGVTKQAIASGFSGPVELNGFLENLAWTWTSGAEIYLNGTALSQTPPGSGFMQQIGIAKSPTVLYVSLVEPILL